MIKGESKLYLESKLYDAYKAIKFSAMMMINTVYDENDDENAKLNNDHSVHCC